MLSFSFQQRWSFAGYLWKQEKHNSNERARAAGMLMLRRDGFKKMGAKKPKKQNVICHFAARQRERLDLKWYFCKTQTLMASVRGGASELGSVTLAAAAGQGSCRDDGSSLHVAAGRCLPTLCSVPTGQCDHTHPHTHAHAHTQCPMCYIINKDQTSMLSVDLQCKLLITVHFMCSSW